MTKVRTILAEFCSPKDILAINRLGLIKQEERENQPIPWRHRLPISFPVLTAIDQHWDHTGVEDSEFYAGAEGVRHALKGWLLKLSPLPRVLLRLADPISRSVIQVENGPLYQRERRDIVLSEMRASLKPPSKLTTREKVKVVEAARTSVDSKLGECLVNKQTIRDSSLDSQLGRLNRDKRRVEITHQQAQEMFMKASRTLRLEPLILVERSPSVQTYFENEQGNELDNQKLPGYMRPLQTGSRTPSTLPTIDAFTLETKKKRNIWEEVLNETDRPRFKSSTMPAIRLSQDEVGELLLGHMLHKPTRENVRRKKFAVNKSSLSGRAGSKYETRNRYSESGSEWSSEVRTHQETDKTKQKPSTSVFITQLSSDQI